MILYFPQKKHKLTIIHSAQLGFGSTLAFVLPFPPHTTRTGPPQQNLVFFLFRFSCATAYPHKPQFECGKVRPISTTTHTRARISPLVPKREAYLVVAKITSLFLHSLLCLAAAAGALHLLIPSRKTGGIRGDHHTLIRLTIFPLQEKYFRC